MDHDKLWKIPQEMGIPDHLTCLLRNLYAGQEVTVRTGHGTTDWFQIGKGVRQGDPQQHIWKALPHTRQEPTPTANGTPPRPAPPGFAPALLGSRRVPCHIGDPREHNRDRPPTHSERNLDLCSPGLPHPGCAPGAFPAAVAISESTTGKPSPKILFSYNPNQLRYIL